MRRSICITKLLNNSTTKLNSSNFQKTKNNLVKTTDRLYYSSNVNPSPSSSETTKISNEETSYNHLFPKSKSRRKKKRTIATPKTINSEKEAQDMMFNQLTPFYSEDYDEQLIYKKSRAQVCLLEIGRKMNMNQLFCPIDQVVSSPVSRGYRNEYQFTFARDWKEDICVGFKVGKMAQGFYQVAYPDQLINTHDVACHISHLASQYAQYKYPDLNVYDKITQNGFWRSLLIRSSPKSKQILISVQVNPETLPSNSEAEYHAQEFLRYVNKEFKNYGGYEIKSLYYQFFGSSQNFANPHLYPHLHYDGNAFIEDELNNKTFYIYPETPFPVNPSLAEIQYNTIADYALSHSSSTSTSTSTKINGDHNHNNQNNNNNNNTLHSGNHLNKNLLLDIFCGSGAFGMSVHHRFDRMIGFDFCRFAANGIGGDSSDHHESKYPSPNAEAMGMDNAVYMPNTPDVAVPSLFQRVDTSGYNISAVIKPPRSGLPSQLVSTIQQEPNIKTLVYVSENINQLKYEIPRLTRYTNFKGIKASVFDSLPYTDSQDTVILMRRD